MGKITAAFSGSKARCGLGADLLEGHAGGGRDLRRRAERESNTARADRQGKNLAKALSLPCAW